MNHLEKITNMSEDEALEYWNSLTPDEQYEMANELGEALKQVGVYWQHLQDQLEVFVASLDETMGDILEAVKAGLEVVANHINGLFE